MTEDVDKDRSRQQRWHGFRLGDHATNIAIAMIELVLPEKSRYSKKTSVMVELLLK